MLNSQKTLETYGYNPDTLTKGSSKLVCITCDYCQKEFTKSYYKYVNSNKSIINKDSCNSCKTKKQAESNTLTGKNKLITQKRINTNITKYGNASPANNTIIQKKIQQNNLKKYGTKYSIHSHQIKLKIKESLVNKYGVDNLFKLKSIQEDIRKNIKNTLGVDSYSQLHMGPDILSKLNSKQWLIEQHHQNKKSLTEISMELGLGNNQNTVSKYLRKHNIEIKKYNISSYEKELVLWLKENYNGNIIQSDRNIISPKELDIYLPDNNLAIEICGLYWHNENYKNSYYHQNKWKQCNNKGIKLITIFDDEWINKKEIIKNKILYSLKLNSTKIFARKCIIKEIGIQETKEFLNNNHIQGNIGFKFSYGLFYNNTLVAVMTFGKPRFNKKYEWELLRYATYGNIIGGASKLFKWFVNTHKPKNVISYCDLRYGLGGVYSKLGFKELGISKPGYFYTDGIIKYNRMKYRKSNLIKLGYDSNKSESQITEEIGLNKIYDCGNKVFLYGEI